MGKIFFHQHIQLQMPCFPKDHYSMHIDQFEFHLLEFVWQEGSFEIRFYILASLQALLLCWYKKIENSNLNSVSENRIWSKKESSIINAITDTIYFLKNRAYTLFF